MHQLTAPATDYMHQLTATADSSSFFVTSETDTMQLGADAMLQ